MHNKNDYDNDNDIIVVYTPIYIRARAAHEAASRRSLGFAGGFLL